MGIIYRKIPLSVSALFLPDGTICPRSVETENGIFRIDKILSRAKRAPQMVSSSDPVEYTVMVRGRRKKIYFDEETGTWFSVKEISS